MRNPFRFSFDRATGKIFCGDAGQDRFEEIDIIEKGGNYGWRFKEGDACFFPPSNCTEFAARASELQGQLLHLQQRNFTLIDPIFTYNHTDFNPKTLETVVIGKKLHSILSLPFHYPSIHPSIILLLFLSVSLSSLSSYRRVCIPWIARSFVGCRSS